MDTNQEETGLALHQTDLLKYRDELREEFEQAVANLGEKLTIDGDEWEDGYTWASERFLAIEVLRRDPGKEVARIEWLLTCGGPHVELTWKLGGGSATLFHSCGAWPNGSDRTTIDFPAHICEQLANLCGIEDEA